MALENALTVEELSAMGLGRKRRTALVAEGLLVPSGSGLYARAPDVPQDPGLQPLWSSLLRCGPGSFLYRQGAAWLWDLDGVPPGTAEVAVAVPRNPRASGRRIRNLCDGDLRRHLGLPVTSPERTLLDLATLRSPDVVERAMESALRKKLLTVASLEGRMALGRARGAVIVREVLARRPPGCHPTESDAETLFVQLVRSRGLPDPVRQFGVRVRGRFYRLDLAWPDVRLATEVDGASVHGPGRFEADIERQNHIVLDGWLVLRFSWRAIVLRPERVGAELVEAWRMQRARFGFR